MMRTRWWELGAFVVALFLAVPAHAAPAPDKGSALAQVPAEAPIVIQVRGLERTKDRLIAMVKNAVPDLGPMLQDKIDEAFKKGLEGRELKGLAPEGPIFFAFTEMPKPGGAMPQMVAIFHVTKYADFRDGLLTEEERKGLKKEDGCEVANVKGMDLYFVDRKGYAAVTPVKEVAAQLAKMETGLDAKLNNELARKLLDSDVALYVNMTDVNKAFGDQIQQARLVVQGLLGQIGGAQLDKNTLEMVKAMYDGMFQLVEDSRAFLITTDFRPEGLALHLQAQVGDDTKTNSILKIAKPGSLEALGQMPAGSMGYLAMAVSPDLLKKFSLLVGFPPGAEGDEGADLRKALDELAAAGPRSIRQSFSFPLQGVQVWDVQNPAKAAEAQLKLYQSLKPGSTYQSAYLKDKPEIKANAETYRGFKLNSVSIVWDFDKLEAGPGGKAAGEILRKMLGEGMKAWFGTDGKVYVVVTAKDWAAAQRQLEQFLDAKDPVTEEKSFADARKSLPAQTSLLYLLDAPVFAQQMAVYMQAALKAAGKSIDLSEIKPSKQKSYMGVAVTVQPERGSFDLWLPVTAVAEIRKMFEPVLKGAKD
jgi:hypothetical protein